MNSAAQGGGPGAAGAVAVLDVANIALGSTFELVRLLRGGLQSGAWLVEDDAGRQAVLKWTPDRRWAAQIQRASSAVALVRRRGYPTPAWITAGITDFGLGYQIQAYQHGQPREYLTLDVASRAVEVLELQRALDPDPGRCWSEYVIGKFKDEWTSTIAGVSAMGVSGSELAEHSRVS